MTILYTTKLKYIKIKRKLTKKIIIYKYYFKKAYLKTKLHTITYTLIY